MSRIFSGLAICAGIILSTVISSGNVFAIDSSERSPQDSQFENGPQGPIPFPLPPTPAPHPQPQPQPHPFPLPPPPAPHPYPQPQPHPFPLPPPPAPHPYPQPTPYPTPDPEPSNYGCTYNLMVDSVLGKSYYEEADTYTEACRMARHACETGIERNSDNLSDFELACYIKRDANNPANKYDRTTVVCGDSTGNYMECLILGRDLKVQIGKVYSSTFGFFKNYESYNDYRIAQASKWNVVANKRQMIEQCGLQNDKWGVTQDMERIWVKDGCSGAFEVLFNRVDGQPNTPDNRTCNRTQLDICLKYAGGNACYAKWCE